jgi:hypothetical protein
MKWEILRIKFYRWLFSKSSKLLKFSFSSQFLFEMKDFEIEIREDCKVIKSIESIESKCCGILESLEGMYS